MRHRYQKYYLQALIVITLIACAAGLYGAVRTFHYGEPLSDKLRMIGSFSCFGILLGTIFCFDAEVGKGVPNKPLLRFLVGALCGLAIAAIWQGPVDAMLLAALAGALLGLMGTAWAKYV